MSGFVTQRWGGVRVVGVTHVSSQGSSGNDLFVRDVPVGHNISVQETVEAPLCLVFHLNLEHEGLSRRNHQLFPSLYRRQLVSTGPRGVTHPTPKFVT